MKKNIPIVTFILFITFLTACLPTPKPDGLELYKKGMSYYKQQMYPEALRSFQEAAKAGNLYAANSIGSMYLKGEGVPVNYDTALICFQQSAKGGFNVAMNNLGY